MSLKVSQVTAIGWSLLSRLQQQTTCPFTLNELESAIEKRDVMDLLLKLDDANGFIQTSIVLGKEAINDAMCDAGEALSGRWARKTGIQENVTCCVMAMVLEAIQQNFRKQTPKTDTYEP